MSGYLYVLFGVISFGASIAGAICGIGGGVIIKPTLDAFGVLSVSSISFLSGCTVLGMTLYTFLKSKISNDSVVDTKTATPLAIGAAVGGVVGKTLFQMLSNMFADKDMVGAVQAACLLVITLGSLLYTLKKDRIRTYHITNGYICVSIGLVLGILSSFLGIGGGPINLVVLFFFFSMGMKEAAGSSLYIILFSQITSLLQTLITHSIPEFSGMLLFLMVTGGILGGISGRVINKKLNARLVARLFIVLMVAIMGINVYNIYQFLT